MFFSNYDFKYRHSVELDFVINVALWCRVLMVVLSAVSTSQLLWICGSRHFRVEVFLLQSLLVALHLLQRGIERD